MLGIALGADQTEQKISHMTGYPPRSVASKSLVAGPKYCHFFEAPEEILIYIQR